MPNSYAMNGNFMTITAGATPADWNSQTEEDPQGNLEGGVFIEYIQWLTDAGNTIRVRQGAVDSEANILYCKEADGTGHMMPISCKGRCFPSIAAADMSAGDIINIHFKRSTDPYEL